MTHHLRNAASAVLFVATLAALAFATAHLSSPAEASGQTGTAFSKTYRATAPAGQDGFQLPNGACIDWQGAGGGKICSPGVGAAVIDAGTVNAQAENLQGIPQSIVQHYSDAGTSGVVSWTWPVAFPGVPDCTCSNSNGTVVACDVTARTAAGFSTKSGSGSDIQTIICAY